MIDIELIDYDYDLPIDRIAQYPVNERDMSQLLIYKDDKIYKDIFRNVYNYIPSDSLLVFNNSRVIRARIIFRKATGASIEVLCLEPLLPSEYELSFSSKEPVEWKCIAGNLKRWKRDEIVTQFDFSGKTYKLKAEKLHVEGDALRVRFSWNSTDISFAEVIDETGHIPLPPYINREDEIEDTTRYQTIYSSIKGSVAAPTAGLHFTDEVLGILKETGIKSAFVTLHIGAGTFKPVKTENISGHEMHCEHFFITRDTIESILDTIGKIIAVGTSSVRTLESLYWIGIKLINNPTGYTNEISLGQWESYEMETKISVKESLESLLKFMNDQNLSYLKSSTSIIIIPGYDFRVISGMITNFHQPRSTLLLLISAWVGKSWKEIYRFALENGFRFLSYGDSSLLIR
jgi:S-adenosylmethionine:tRNA ribosyltransferase-isomerase